MDHGHIARTSFPAWLRIALFLSSPVRRLISPRGTLVVLPGGLGDVLLFSGALWALRRHSPAEPLIVACRENTVPLLEREDMADAVIPICPDAAVTGIGGRVRRIWNGIRILQHRYHRVLHPVFNTVAQAHQVCALADGERKVWFDGGQATEDEVPAFDPRTLYTQLVQIDTGAHELDKAVDFLRAIGLTEVRSRDDIRPEIHLTDKEKRKAHDVVAATQQASPGALRLAVCAGARFKQKDWGVENFAELLRRLSARRAVVAFLIGDESDREGCSRITGGTEYGSMGVWGYGGKGAEEDRSRLDPAGNGTKAEWTPILRHSHTPILICLAGKLTVRESAALIAECDLCVGNDTFGLHAAIAVGTPSVVIMGGGNFGRWTPWGDPKRHRMANAPMDCYGCGWKCIHPEYRCIRSITVEQVAKEVETVLG